MGGTGSVRERSGEREAEGGKMWWLPALLNPLASPLPLPYPPWFCVSKMAGTEWRPIEEVDDFPRAME